MRRVILGAVAGVVLAGGAAWAVVPGGDVIHGCTGRNGALRVVAAGESCKAAETPLDWNRTGLQGPPGVSEYTVVTESPEIPGGTSFREVSVFCPAGTKILGAGLKPGFMGPVQSWADYPAGSTGWTFEVANLSNASSFPSLIAICAAAT